MGREGPTEVTHNMTLDIESGSEEATIAAKVLKTMVAKKYSFPSKVSIENLAPQTPVPSHQEGKVPEVVETLAEDDQYPVRYVDIGETVALKVDSHQWAASQVRALDESVMTWRLEQKLD